MRAWIVAIIAVLLGSHGGPVWAASPRMGVASLRPDEPACVTVRGQPLRPGDRCWIILFSPPRIVDGAIRERATGPCDSTASLEGGVYKVQLRFSLGPEQELGIAVFAPGGRAEYLEGEFVINTPDAKTPLSFRSCASSEGIHLTAWRGNRRTWHEYVYLGFDLESNCTEEEAGE